MSQDEYLEPSSDIAIVGMAGRFPKATTVDAFWQNIRNEVECTTAYDDEMLIAAGVDKAVVRNPNYVKVGTPLPDMEMFDAPFFGLSPKEGAIMDPQHRHFLEVSWEALERAGHVPEQFDGAIGVFGGSGLNAYMPYNLFTNPDLMKNDGLFLVRHTGNDKDMMATRVSYCFDLRGPSLNVQTACSTSLVAIHLACQSIINGECDMALAGGATIELPHHRGYLYEEGEILSPDGHCRAFDAKSKGTFFGSAVAAVVLRRLDEALADGDVIHAVIKGSAINNDGSMKMGYLAPSVDGQAAAISEALAVAELPADAVSYVECHGTGTPVGDPIEVAALTQAFEQTTNKQQFCGIGSVKSNIGHTDTAAGVCGIIKVAKALESEVMPATLNYSTPNPTIEFEESPFYVNAATKPWPREQARPRRAGVSSLGVGGTNAHVVLEEAPEREASDPAEPWQLLVVSGKNETARDNNAERLANYLQEHPQANLADVAYTLQVGRKGFAHRRVVACSDAADAIKQLTSTDSKERTVGKAKDAAPSVVFMFPGGGAQYPNMGRDLYHGEPVFRAEMDRCLTIVKNQEGIDLKPVLYPQAGADLEQAAKTLARPSYALPAIFATEAALAQLWLAWGVRPQAMTGHSLGEYAAAYLCGVLSLEDAIKVVTLRGVLFEQVASGSMLSVSLREEDVKPLLVDGVSIAALNAPDLTVVSGAQSCIAAMAQVLDDKGVEYRRLKIDVAAHSAVLDPILAQFEAGLQAVQFHPPQALYVSNVTGTWVRAEDAQDPKYWVRHLRHTVRFADGVGTLLDEADRIFIEVGPGTTLTSLSRVHEKFGGGHKAVASLRHPKEQVQDQRFIRRSLGQAWAYGMAMDWQRLHHGSRRRKLALPTYAFNHKRHWIEPGKAFFDQEGATGPGSSLQKVEDQKDWFFQPTWREQPLAKVIPASEDASTTNTIPAEPMDWLVLGRDRDFSEAFALFLEALGHRVVRVHPGLDFTEKKGSGNRYVINPEIREHYDQLLGTLAAAGKTPQRIVSFWGLGHEERHLYRNFDSLFLLAQALGEHGEDTPVHLAAVVDGLQQVADESAGAPLKALALGPCRVIPQELPHVSCQLLDLPCLDEQRRLWARGSKRTLIARAAAAATAAMQGTPSNEAKGAVDASLAEPSLRDGVQLLDQLGQELIAAPTQAQVLATSTTEPTPTVVAFRGRHRFVLDMQRAPLPKPPAAATHPKLKHNGVYLFTGGLGGMALAQARYLAKVVQARLVLVSRGGLPAPETWDQWVAEHGAGDRWSRQIRQVRTLQEAGAQVLVCAADVTDQQAMQGVLAHTHKHFGPINGVVHAAGSLADDLLQLKNIDNCRRVLAPKVEGTLVLESVLQNEPLDFVALCSSTSATMGAAGQIDYTSANAFLNSYATYCSTGKGLGAPRTVKGKGVINPYVVAVNWGIWAQVGMAAQAARGLTTDSGDTQDGRHSSVSRPMAHPLLGACLEDTPTRKVYLKTYRVEDAWVLDEHRIKGGEALIPGTGYLEIARAALEQDAVCAKPVRIEDVFFMQPLEVRAGEPKDVRVVLTRDALSKTDDGSASTGADTEASYDFVISSQDVHGAWHEHCRGRVGYRPATSVQPTTRDLEGIRLRCSDSQVTFAPLQQETQQERYLDFGPRWKNLRQVNYGASEGLARLELLPKYESDLRHLGLHPALLDLATGYGLPLVEGYTESNSLYVPLTYGSITVHGPLPRKVLSHVVSRFGNSADAEVVTFDITLMDERGTVLVVIEGFTNRKVDAALMAAGQAGLEVSGQGVATAQAHAAGGNSGGAGGAPDEESFLALGMREGIQPHEGAEALARILAHGGQAPQVVATSLDMHQLMAYFAPKPVVASQGGNGAGGATGDDDTNSSYVAPRDTLETELAKLWGQLLGVGRVGIEDDFFELGGHSLIAVRLFSKIKKAYKVDLSLATLFEAPTIEKCAEVIRDELGLEFQPAGEGEASDGATTTAADDGNTRADGSAGTAATDAGNAKGGKKRTRRAWSPLVPIQPKGDRVPFFCVHGAGGNVLNFRELVQGLDADQPFYGLQAQGADGKAAPLRTIEDMATLYLKEVRRVQPHGPYILGGYSGGGVVAFEMARQLEAAGEETAQLIFLDTFYPHLPPRKESARDKVARVLKVGLHRWLRNRWSREALRWKRWQVRHYHRKGLQLPHALREVAMTDLFFEAADSYRPKTFPGKITLFRAQQIAKIYDHVGDALGWNGMAAQGIDIHQVPGSHETLVLEPNVNILVQQLSHCLRQVEKR